MNWKGVIPAITTTFTQDLHVDHSSVTKHCRWLLDNGCTGIVALGLASRYPIKSSFKKWRDF
jgi:4-hydroxy-tetrahydrodipicolinate synthase